RGQYADSGARAKSRRFFARGLRISWPHLVLLAAYLFYLGIGGWIFLAIEGGSQPDFSREVDRYEVLKAQIDGAVRNLTKGQRVTVANLTDIWEEYTALVEDPYLDDLTHLSRVDWTYTGSVLFCATSIATIGYGDAVPVTAWGRVVIVIYSLIGIPLTLTFLADIGGILARLVVLLAGKCQCSRQDRRSPRPVNQSQDLGNAMREPLHHQNGLSTRSTDARASSAYDHVEERGDIMEMRFSLGVFKDSADPVRGSQPNSRRSSMDVEAAQQAELDQLAKSSKINTLSGNTNLAFAPDGETREEEKKTPSSPRTSPDSIAVKGTDNREDTGSEQRHVPVVLVVAILLMYTFIGALMIAYVEGWYYGEALYFTFITLTTIGFGDFVPVKHYMDIPSFFGCLVYTIVGLSVMSMCIALVQAKVVGLMSRVAGKIGF
ncbi:TWiK family of potassium channels protein 18-like, partial [Patiria miniata]|uniref:Potassium channel domain-containing protein n=1 Tax=Patiria miniata TaxID=46514 RepID=A0A914B4V3_PATMI